MGRKIKILQNLQGKSLLPGQCGESLLTDSHQRVKTSQTCHPIRVHQRHLHPQGSVGPNQHEMCPHRKHLNNPQPIPGGQNQWQVQQLFKVDMEHFLIFFCEIGYYIFWSLLNAYCNSPFLLGGVDKMRTPQVIHQHVQFAAPHADNTLC